MKKVDWPTDAQMLQIDSIWKGKSILARKLNITPGAVSGRIRKIKGNYKCTYCGKHLSDYRSKLCRACSAPPSRCKCNCGASIDRKRTKCYRCWADNMISFFPLHHDGYPSNANLLLISQIPHGQVALARRLGVSKQRIHQKIQKAKIEYLVQ